jgi:predicted enzyme related to lactoylglutathione lyase
MGNTERRRTLFHRSFIQAIGSAEELAMKYLGLVWAGVNVEDLESSISFYQDTLGLPLLGRGTDWAHFDSGAGTLLELFTGGTATPEPKKPHQQSIVLGLRVDDLDHVVAELKEKGVHFNPEESGEFEGTRWAHFVDPEGNQLEVKEIP